MPRETESQRAATAAAAPREQRDRGYETRDADPRRVIIATSLFIALLLTGFIAAAVTVVLTGGWRGQAPDPTPALIPLPKGAPPLLADPVAARRREAEAERAHLDPARIARARAALIRSGWPVPGPASAPAKAARDHVEAVR